MNRLFTFGCSFTSYKWPSWADIIGREFDEFQNWGQSGGGNHFIFNSINECVLRNNIGKDDMVVVMWSNILREDRYVKHKWLTPGNIYTQPIYNEEFVMDFIDERGCYIRDIAMIHSAKILLEHHGVNYIFLSMVPITNVSQYSASTLMEDDVTELYQETINVIRPSVYEVIFNFDWESRVGFNKQTMRSLFGLSEQTLKENGFGKLTGKIKEAMQSIRSLSRDIHPTPAEHLEYTKLMIPEINISNETIEWIMSCNSKLSMGLPIDDWDKFKCTPHDRL